MEEVRIDLEARENRSRFVAIDLSKVPLRKQPEPTDYKTGILKEPERGKENE